MCVPYSHPKTMTLKDSGNNQSVRNERREKTELGQIVLWLLPFKMKLKNNDTGVFLFKFRCLF